MRETFSGSSGQISRGMPHGAGGERLPWGGQEGWLAETETSTDCSKSGRCRSNLLANVDVKFLEERGGKPGGVGSKQSLVQKWLVQLCRFPWQHPAHPLLLGNPAPIPRHPPPLFYPRKLSLTSQIYFPFL